MLSPVTKSAISPDLQLYVCRSARFQSCWRQNRLQTSTFVDVLTRPRYYLQMPSSKTAIVLKRPRRLQMQYAGGLVKHLGLSMYRGAVPALAELISNSWDADATKVTVTVPFGVGMKDQRIIVADNGRGMTWDEVQQAYLVVGRDRRKAEGEKTPGNRVVMGRKGLGKRAGFGIAQVVEVRTVCSRWATHFQMDFEKITKGGQAIWWRTMSQRSWKMPRQRMLMERSYC